MIEKKIITNVGLLEKYKSIIQDSDPIRSLGSVDEIIGNIVIAQGPDTRLGDLCHIEKVEDESYVLSEVVGFRGSRVMLSPLDTLEGVFPGGKVLSLGTDARISLSEGITGRVIDGLGRPLDGKGKVTGEKSRSFYAKPPNPLSRPVIQQPLETGIRAVDGFLSIGQGQRIGIFAGSGVGKSTLMGMIARYASADVNVIALIGERGREVREFIENDLGEEGLSKSVVVVASSNESPMIRIRAAYLATTIAEFFRDKQKNVMLMMDSLTRLAMAKREVGLSAGEPVTTRGYTPSVFSMLPELLERAGTSEKGSITGIYTVLVEADDMNEPISDAVRGILDGHVVLSRKLAIRGQYPAIDVVESISRLMPAVITRDHYARATRVREYLSEYRQNEEIINLGAYIAGSNPVLDAGMHIYPELLNFLKQSVDEFSPFSDTVGRLNAISEKAAYFQTRGRAVR